MDAASLFPDEEDIVVLLWSGNDEIVASDKDDDWFRGYQVNNLEIEVK